MYLMGSPDSFGFINYSVEVRWLMFSGYFMYVFPISVWVSPVTQSHVVSLVTPVQCLCPWKPSKGGVGMLLAVLTKGVKSHSLGMRWL